MKAYVCLRTCVRACVRARVRARVRVCKGRDGLAGRRQAAPMGPLSAVLPHVRVDFPGLGVASLMLCPASRPPVVGVSVVRGRR